MSMPPHRVEKLNQEPGFPEKFSSLRQRIIKKRNQGKVLMAYGIGRGSDDRVLKNFFKRLDLGMPTRTPDEALAEDILATAIWKELAHTTPLMDEEEARSLAREFISLFDHGQRTFLTNTPEAPYKDPTSWGWDGITSAGIDTGILVYDNVCIGILWFEDED